MSKFKMSRRMAILSAASLMSLATAAQEIKLGFNGDLSASPSAQSGAAGVLGIQAAIEDINAAGGINGRKLTLVIRDDQSQPPKSIQNMSDLIDNEKVVAVFGPTNSGNAMAWKHIPNQKKVVSMGMIGGGTDITKNTGGDNYMFRVSMVDREQVAGIIAYAQKAGYKKVGLLTETTGYGAGGLKDMQEIGKLHGIDVSVTEKFAVADTDMTSQLNKMKAAGVDAVAVWAQGTPTGQLMRSMEKINYFPPVLSSWAADNITFHDAAGKTLAEKPIFMRTMVDPSTPKQKQLFERTKAKLAAASAFPFVVHGYDAVQLIAASIRQAGSTDGEKMRAALEDLKEPVAGAMKSYSKPFSKLQHEALTAADFAFVKWNAGKLVQVTDPVIKSLTTADFKR
ncbi:branched-chain amino acid ABC transporter substrate-binding protein [Limnohabitans sp. MMS-10A-160]|jgi:branched-chain amino acid transport system substrate-binding protein|uniref:ABC transporter substrate-binding protein n=1 Tax=unclassified Limnohabitans TaxID=2626134 RepID=UPI000DD225F1|nr:MULTISPECIES: ABC transporter substrate-binding protein [unclassified Limnohabitans]PUE20518.1 branched-chain amino acid ABC transporter substrate-binding protein [Limnohabitans sp. MMS-10A-192]PUE25095.1 branched-chain amino acid ABC transporter substrate-binding protein [Limnohabitans sp. MMS-10A-160]